LRIATSVAAEESSTSRSQTGRFSSSQIHESKAMTSKDKKKLKSIGRRLTAYTQQGYSSWNTEVFVLLYVLDKSNFQGLYRGHTHTCFRIAASRLESLASRLSENQLLRAAHLLCDAAWRGDIDYCRRANGH
jgi:hypothetical protein